MQVYTDYSKHIHCDLFAVSISISVSALMHRPHQMGIVCPDSLVRVLAVRVAKCIILVNSYC